MTSTLIITTYNRPDALEVCLESVRRLHTLPDEVIIGDDGSGEETADMIRRISRDFPVPLRHIWQPDNGFRAAMVRNRCVAAATGEYIIQIDGDIWLHPDFVSDHLRHARKGVFLKGGRVRIGPSLTARICASRRPRRITPLTRGLESKRPNTLRLPMLAAWLAPRYRRNRDNVLGCNMSYFRSDFMAVNGYDEAFEGWGGEDLDLGFRLRNAGIRKHYLKFCALGYHMWHREASMDRSDSNHALARRHRAEGLCRATRGVDRYLTDGSDKPEP